LQRILESNKQDSEKNKKIKIQPHFPHSRKLTNGKPKSQKLPNYIKKKWRVSTDEISTLAANFWIKIEKSEPII